ncbi:hypothetical protein LEP1GSC173_3136 [Leptospira interrogans str. HAI1594]|uniref:Uncharacterized protein n=2 Tax=Leptospira interrogans TaxID=173 RepID=N1UJB6_LEPIR|nr:hypothetical protein LEP1GSC027_4312 [Leptospira interrogans str. 2002000624]EKP23579.1 hypothetical protein LEP1GSC117_2060 [Leptospira interrogans serovar Icterohaemorrhagiae str. Verdun LP]EKP76765.1 hypothetical protein LEP1GSC173_3136 [Leptospira interrogans str. HAI1594]EKP84843.1 hypothetical protein LEP1GSC020_0437 [Leptospira interrogans serovar Grippotyphosa str. 2006006986]EKQ38001.1 hypothetical protein LEP1GSC025_4265 [Leptospira interrogans str. 2002000621]EKQ49863.1 hypotheti
MGTLTNSGFTVKCGNYHKFRSHNKTLKNTVNFSQNGGKNKM